VLAGCIIVQQPPGAYSANSYPSANPNDPAATNDPPQSDSQMQQLVAPIAMDPDPILADILPASTYPEQIQDAEIFLQQNPSPTDEQVDAHDWDPSIKALVHDPDALAQLDHDPDWAQSLGSAYTNDRPDVMAAVQDLRTRAQQLGNLQTNDQVTVVQDNQSVAIVPTDPSNVSVPTFDPNAVYVTSTQVTWSSACPTGAWLIYGVNWSAGGSIFVGHGWDDGWYRDYLGWHPRYFTPRPWFHNYRFGYPPARMFNYHLPRNIDPGRFQQVPRSPGGEFVQRSGLPRTVPPRAPYPPRSNLYEYPSQPHVQPGQAHYPPAHPQPHTPTPSNGGNQPGANNNQQKY